MGVSSTVKIRFYKEQKEQLLTETELADLFIYFFVNGSTYHLNFRMTDIFDETECKVCKIYFDKDSASVIEGLETPVINIQDPKVLNNLWGKFKTQVIKQYKEQIESATKENERQTKIMDFVWSMFGIGEIMASLKLAEKNQYLIEITLDDL